MTLPISKWVVSLWSYVLVKSVEDNVYCNHGHLKYACLCACKPEENTSYWYIATLQTPCYTVLLHHISINLLFNHHNALENHNSADTAIVVFKIGLRFCERGIIRVGLLTNAYYITSPFQSMSATAKHSQIQEVSEKYWYHRHKQNIGNCKEVEEAARTIRVTILVCQKFLRGKSPRPNTLFGGVGETPPTYMHD